ncbi:flagellar basal body P-ring formation chaperone FlgA [Flaviflagellibacter deserti]|jgi:flagellar basal body P-ring formation protein FlgA|uniref:Flagella basal body P-ring formation protein FlgA n=1 Tax=Flaviflagellibacter deserti TaxID=2267266 RepID=A0ABV9Z8A7_9HYPH
MRFLPAAAAVCVAVLACTYEAKAQAVTTVPVPGITIYPGDPITDEVLTDRRFRLSRRNLEAVVASREIMVGKIARRTLLPGQPVTFNAIEEPKLVRRGVPVRLIFIEGSLTIITYAEPLQTGSVGEIIRVRNTESGTVITGVVQKDGSIIVGKS